MCWDIVTRTAEILTILAFLIAIAGVISVFLSRPRLKLEPLLTSSDELIVVLRNCGESPARNVQVDVAKRKPDGSVGSGGDILFLPVLHKSIPMHFYDPAQLNYQGHVPEHSQKLASGTWLDVVVTWQSPLRPWKRKSMLAQWQSEVRANGGPPLVLHGRRARKEIDVGRPVAEG